MARQPHVVFIAHAFAPRCGSYELGAFREMLQSIERELNLAAEAGGAPSVTFITDLESDGPSIRPVLMRALADADVAVFDVSDNNPNVLFELGHLAARGVPMKILKSRKSLDAGYKVPIYVADEDVEFYAAIGEVRDVVFRWLQEQLTPANEARARAARRPLR